MCMVCCLCFNLSETVLIITPYDTMRMKYELFFIFSRTLQRIFLFFFTNFDFTVLYSTRDLTRS